MRIQLLTPDGAKFLGFAESKLSILRLNRSNLRVPLLEERFLVDGFHIFIRASEFGDLVRISGGGGTNPHLVFAASPAEIQLSIYNYVNDVLTDTEQVTGNLGELHQYFNAVCHYNDTKNTAGKAVEPLEIIEGGVSVLRFGYEHEYILTQGNLYVRKVDETLIRVANLAVTGAIWTPQYSRAQDAFIFLPRYPTTEIWNLNKVMDMWAYAPATQSVLPIFHWVPSFFFAEPGNGIFGTGWHYGKFLDWWVEPPDGDSIREGDVVFGGLLENQKQSAQKAYGYCEILTNMDDVDKFLITFFTSSTPFPTEANPTWVRQTGTGSKGGGTLTAGKSRDFSIDALAEFGALAGDPGIHWWNAGWQTPENEAPPTEGHDLTGVVVTANGKTVLYRYTGALTTLLVTENYHSHAVSTSGRFCAVFEGETVIERALIYDLQENTQVQDSVVPAEALALSAAWIPRTPIGQTAFTNDLEQVELTTIEDEDTYKFRAHYGVVNYSEGDNLATSGSKMVCPDGVHASIVPYDDECFEATLVKIEPAGVPPFGAVSVTIAGETFNAAQFQDLTEAIPYILFSSMGPPPTPYEIVVCHWVKTALDTPLPEEIPVSGTNVRVSVIERADMSLGQFTSGQIFIKNALGDVTRNGFDENGEITEELDECGTDLTVSATTSCGQSASLEIENPDPSPLTVGTTPRTLDFRKYASAPFQFVVAGGGVPPYTYSSSCGTVNSTTGFISDSTGCCAPVTITAVDACGTSAEAVCTGDTINWEIQQREIIRFDVAPHFTKTITIKTGGPNPTWIEHFYAYEEVDCSTPCTSLFSAVATVNGCFPDYTLNTWQSCDCVPWAGPGPGFTSVRRYTRRELKCCP